MEGVRKRETQRRREIWGTGEVGRTENTQSGDLERRRTGVVSRRKGGRQGRTRERERERM